MPLESMYLYQCSVCGHTMAGLEWEEQTGNLKDYKCPSCQHLLNEDELYSEEETNGDN
jgi:DNA-directed RNA polymerase subunit RPC12/RpoP